MIKIHFSSEAKIGLISVLVLAITIWGYNFLKGKNIIKPTDEYYVVFDRIDGLIEAGNVMMLGYKVGNIRTIKFDHEHTQKFIVKIELEERVKLSTESYIKVKQINPLAATSDLEIVPGKNNMYYKSGDTLRSVVNKGIAEILISLQSKVENVLIDIDSTLQSFNQILTPESRSHLKSGIENLNASLEAINNSLTNGGSLHKSFDNIQSVTDNLKSNNEEITAILHHLSNVSTTLDSADIKSTLHKLDETLTSTREIMNKINDGDGTIGKLVNDSSLYANLDSTSSNLNVLIKDLKAHPKRYVHVSVFGGKEK